MPQSLYASIGGLSRCILPLIIEFGLSMLAAIAAVVVRLNGAFQGIHNESLSFSLTFGLSNILEGDGKKS